jgi:hypothetical protein
MTPGEKVVAVARKYLGVRENPMGSNLGKPQPEGWQAKPWGMKGVPWCGCAVAGWYAEAGVDDEGIAHPSTWTMYQTAQKKKAIINSPVVGCMFVYPGIHTGIVTQVLPGNRVATLEGNTADSVGTHIRAYGPGTNLYFLAPKVLRRSGDSEPVKPLLEYWVEDVKAQPRLRGPWLTKAGRDKALAKLPYARRRLARPIRVGRKYAFLEGPRRLFGPWSSTEARDNALKSLKKNRTEGAFRTFSKRAPVAQADSLGKTV